MAAAAVGPLLLRQQSRPLGQDPHPEDSLWFSRKWTHAHLMASKCHILFGDVFVILTAIALAKLIGGVQHGNK